MPTKPQQPGDQTGHDGDDDGGDEGRHKAVHLDPQAQLADDPDHDTAKDGRNQDTDDGSKN
ncbi:MAG: hypothetical protein R2844_14200 [Caldilineales bacterium]